MLYSIQHKNFMDIIMYNYGFQYLKVHGHIATLYTCMIAQNNYNVYIYQSDRAVAYTIIIIVNVPNSAIIMQGYEWWVYYVLLTARDMMTPTAQLPKNGTASDPSAIIGGAMAFVVAGLVVALILVILLYIR